MNHDEYVTACREWLARRKAWLAQREKQFEDQYPFMSPSLNLKRHDDIQAWKFELEVHEWELEEIIRTHEPYPQLKLF